MKKSTSTIAKAKVQNSKSLSLTNAPMSTALVLIPKEEKKKLSAEMLDALTALNISEDIKQNADRKSIFKKEFNNKADRTKCRNKFLNSVSLYLLHVQHNKEDKAIEQLALIKECANHYYIAGETFSKVEDYCSNTMDENKRNLIKMFININAQLQG